MQGGSERAALARPKKAKNIINRVNQSHMGTVTPGKKKMDKIG